MYIIPLSIITWMIWRYCHHPNCLTLYGGLSTSDSFLDCENSNMRDVFLVQIIAIIMIFVSLGISILVGILWGD